MVHIVHTFNPNAEKRMHVTATKRGIRVLLVDQQSAMRSPKDGKFSEGLDALPVAFLSRGFSATLATPASALPIDTASSIDEDII